MTLSVKILKLLLADSGGMVFTGLTIPAFQTVTLPDARVAKAAHVARDHVPLHRRLQIRIVEPSRSEGKLKMKVRFLWRYEWDSSPQLSPSRSAC